MEQTNPQHIGLLRPQEYCERNKKGEKGSQTENTQKVQRDQRVDDITTKRLAFEKNREAEAKTACVEELNSPKMKKSRAMSEKKAQVSTAKAYINLKSMFIRL